MRLLHFFLTVILFTSYALIYASVPQLEQQGDLVWQGIATQGGYARIRLPAGSQVQLDGRPLNINDQGESFIGFSMNQTPLTLEWQHNGRMQSYLFQVRARQYQSVHVRSETDVSNQHASPEVTSLLDRTTQGSSNRNDWRSDFVWPMVGELGQSYGSQRVYDGEQSELQTGITILRPNGTPVISPLAGVVNLVAGDDQDGMVVVIDHGFSLFSVLSNLQRVDVRQGQSIRQGALLGQVGPDRQRGRHYLQWQVRWQGHWLDPLLLLEPQLSWPRQTPMVAASPAPASPASIQASPASPVAQSAEPALRVLPGCEQSRYMVLLSASQRELEWQHYARQLQLHSECIMRVDNSLRLNEQQLYTLESLHDEVAIIVQDVALFALMPALADLDVQFGGNVLLLDPPVLGNSHKADMLTMMQYFAQANITRSRWYALVPSVPLQSEYIDFYQSLPFIRWFEQRSFDTGLGLIQHAGLHYPPHVWQEMRDFIAP